MRPQKHRDITLQIEEEEEEKAGGTVGGGRIHPQYVNKIRMRRSLLSRGESS